MSLYISCGMMIFIILLIIFLFLRRKRIEAGVSEFYNKNQFYGVKEIPANIKNAIGDGNWVYFKSSLVVEHKPFEFYWLEQFVTSQVGTNATTYHYLTIAFPPDTVSQEFMKKAESLKESEGRKTDFFALNTDKPFRVEQIVDGSFIMSWQVLNSADLFQKKIDWLQENLS